ncbi:putative ATP synthase delta chain mitochondrial precursor [Saitoella complicata NRRL Y-17804]|uniref:putative ATP synthase delta chain mitochondrial precursor n=1 Tax=Saitoella complicata (strain BCRC 22490 / CBS 7301 / JCM 7358 / NBRC 10748 / NRRL Y-17804) TaxID=698492 RepID=UPI0008676CF1|nr:putative ATP synthase delta chain mitochondrial precursor [Saitoella complicata NRRL Y-17804]ODQ51325.1 putative ATP synthase delta chain mitochondrial precursor [Saitoella complicata NRRL Y-17804]
MFALRTVRLAARSAAPALRRGYAEAVPADRIRLTLSLPHQAVYKASDVVQVNIPATAGDMGILASHVPSVQQLKAGLVEVIEEGGSAKQFFVSGGFAVVQPGSQLSINAVEAHPITDFSAEAIRNALAEAQRVAGGNGSEADVAEAKIEVEVLEALQVGSG